MQHTTDIEPINEKSKDSLLYLAKRAITRAVKRIAKMCYNPLDLFKEISTDPDYTGPFMLIFLTAAISVIEPYLIFSNMFEEYEGKLFHTTPPLETLNIMFAWRTLGVILMWLGMFAVFWTLLKALKYEVDGYALLSASGYMFAIQFVLFAVDTVFMYAVSRSFKTLVVVPLKYIRWNLVTGSSITVWYDMLPAYVYLIRNIYQWFFPLWSAVNCVILIKSMTDSSWIRSGMLGSLSYLVIALMSLFMRAAGFL